MPAQTPIKVKQQQRKKDDDTKKESQA